MTFTFIITSISIFISYIFNRKLNFRYGKFKMLEVGYILNLFICAYIVGPSLAYIFSSYTPGDPLSYILDGFITIYEHDFNINLLRLVIFQSVFCGTYFYFRKKKSWLFNKPRLIGNVIVTIVFGIALLGIYFTLIYMSKDFSSYVESYNRYDHIKGAWRIIISMLVRFKFAISTIFLISLFTLDSKKILKLIAILFLISLESYYSAGARISLLFTILQIFFLFSLFHFIPKISLRNTFLIILPLFVLFTAIEKLRTNQQENESLDTLVSIPGEVGAVFFPSIFLYEKRSLNLLPPKNIGMFFYDFTGAFLPNSWIKNDDPMVWFKTNYFPESDVPPFTLGPIANTAIWEGNIGILIRSWILGFLLAEITNLVYRKWNNMLKLLSYTFIFSSSVMIMKYSIFYHFTPFVKSIMPIFIIYLIIVKLTKFYRHEYYS